MMIIRPVKGKDLDALEGLAKRAKVGLTTLIPDRDLLKQKIDASIKAFSAARTRPGDDHYLFVLEESRTGRIVGTSGLAAAVGMKEAFYSYKLGVVVHASRELKVYNRFSTLYLSNDYTGCTELCTLFLDPEYRHKNSGKLLSKCRFLFMAEFPRRFAEKVIVELRGYCDARGRSPFWEGLGRYFFSMDFSQADFLSGAGHKSFIAELMPKHPIYVNLLGEKARRVIGKVHKSTAPALRILEKEGFSFQGYVDIFDAGPTIEAQRANIHSVKASQILPVSVQKAGSSGPWCLISNRKAHDFRCGLVRVSSWPEGPVIIGSVLAQRLGMADGDKGRIVSL